MRPVHTVGKVPGCFSDGDRRFLHKIILSDFTEMCTRNANKQSFCFGLGSCPGPADEQQP